MPTLPIYPQHRYMTRNRIGNHPRTPIDTMQNLLCNACLAGNGVLLLKVNKKSVCNSSAELGVSEYRLALTTWGKV